MGIPHKKPSKSLISFVIVSKTSMPVLSPLSAWSAEISGKLYTRAGRSARHFLEAQAVSLDKGAGFL
jgi:hypothetical protein